MREALLIINPSSGTEEAKEMADSVEEKLAKLYDKVTVKYTEKEGDATAFAKQGAQNRVAAVFVMGGDGTVSEGINGLAEQEYRPDFSFIPLGTVNDLARAVGISLDPNEAIAQLENLEKRSLDVGKVNNHYFCNVVAVGTLPETVQEVDSQQKKRLGPLAYFLEGSKALGANKAYTFDLTIDGEHITQESSLVLVALTNSVGGFENLLPAAAPDDGHLHLVALKGKEIMDKLTVIPKLFTGNAVNDDKILYRKFKTGRIQIQDTEDLASNVDGDAGESLPLELKVLPSHLTILVSKK